MQVSIFKIEEDSYIELCNLLKVCNLVNSGGEAKIMISEGAVTVNGEVEYRKRKKVRVGDIVVYLENKIQVELSQKS